MWATEDELDCTLNSNPKFSAIVASGQCYCFVPVASVMSVHHIVISNHFA